MKKITIVGAGFSGLTLARELLVRGFSVEVLEKSNRPGGLIDSYKTHAGLVETAATSILMTEKSDRLCRELGIEVLSPSNASKKRFFYVGDRRISSPADGKPHGHLARWPLKLSETVALAINFIEAKLKRSLKPLSGETIEDWGLRNLGRPVVEKLIGPALQGIYATDASRLSASLVLGPMFEKKRKAAKYRGFVSPKEGMFALIRALETDILSKGGVIHYGCEVTSLMKPVVIATPAPAAAKLAKMEDAGLTRRIESLKYSPLITMTAFYDEPAGLKGFGCLVPRHFGVRTVGVLLNHAIFPGRDSRFGETWILGGANDESVIDLTDDELKELLKSERDVLFGKKDAAIDVVITRWPMGLPNYDLLLEDVLKDIRTPEGVWFHGNWLGGIGLSKILERSEALAEKIARELA